MSTPERMKILEMIAAGQISAEEAARLLDAASSAPTAAASAPAPAPAAKPAAASVTPAAGTTMKGRRLRVKVEETDGTRVNVNLPLSLMEIGLKIGGRFVDELKDLDAEMEMLIQAINNDVQGKIVEVDDDNSHVEIYIE